MQIEQTLQKHLTPSLSKAIEVVAVLSNLLYTFLYLQGNEICFFFGFLGSLSFAVLCLYKRILAESGLQLFYMAMAVYGYLNMGAEWKVLHYSWLYHGMLLAMAGVATFALARILKSRTTSRLPALDSFTSIFSVGATWLMVNFVHENWLYWIAIDLVSVYLYYKRGMVLGALLFVLYTLMAIDGFFSLELFTW